MSKFHVCRVSSCGIMIDLIFVVRVYLTDQERECFSFRKSGSAIRVIQKEQNSGTVGCPGYQSTYKPAARLDPARSGMET